MDDMLITSTVDWWLDGIAVNLRMADAIVFSKINPQNDGSYHVLLLIIIVSYGLYL